MSSNLRLSPNQYLENITKMFNEEQLTDVTLCCKDGSIRAHKVVLATCSPYFHKIFLENDRSNLVVVMHGVRFAQLQDLIELIYKRNVNVPPENLDHLYDLVEEFQIVGLADLENTNETEVDGGETRQRGQKRTNDNEELVERLKKNRPPPSPILSSSNKAQITYKTDLKKEHPEDETDNSETPIREEVSPESPKLSAWAKKQRKFKCLLCPSSFKRSSHLTRHQLVHTGERPFACDQCDKAFSRHDKLKHHIRKAHETNAEVLSEALTDDYDLSLCNLPPNSPSPLPFIISQVESVEINCSSPDGTTPAKRGRGRPRKHPIGFIPITTKPLIKRGRGRPRINPITPTSNQNGENYDITNLPFGDLEYLTMPIIPQRIQDPEASMIIEPFVEIKTEKESDVSTSIKKMEEVKEEEEEEQETEDEENIKEQDEQMQQLQLQRQQPVVVPRDVIVGQARVDEAVCDSIINKITKIGECTISVANH